MFSSPGVPLSEVVHHGQQALLQASHRPLVYLVLSLSHAGNASLAAGTGSQEAFPALLEN